MGKKYYVVWNGVETGVFDNWEDCKQQINGYKDAKYKSFDSREAAIEAYRGNPADHLGLIRRIAAHRAMTVNYAAFPEIDQNAIAVDAACSHNPGPVEYQGVNVGSGTRIFHVGPLQQGTNNIGEFLALVHALALLDKHGRHDITIYSDSRTAQGWVKKGKCNTKIAPTPDNAPLRALIARAETWLANHRPLRNPIIKWQTERWGEIPADFGRK